MIGGANLAPPNLGHRLLFEIDTFKNMTDKNKSLVSSEKIIQKIVVLREERILLDTLSGTI
jgi:hypothetical protein